jgi:peptidoglycan hydrolase-like protein with peptidoglycan-binding domain/3D (Asp-Asp-Asp) domain-containing protein
MAASVIAPSVSAATVTGPIGCVTLVAGDSGMAVRVLQGDLAQLGYYGGVVNGVFGATTSADLKAFQQHHGLAANGALDLTTLEAIAGAMGLGTVTPACGGASTGSAGGSGVATVAVSGPIGCVALQEGDHGMPVRVLQGDLRQLGYFSGAVNGVFALSTQTALESLQRAHGLPVTGALNAGTLDAIGVAMGLGNVTPKCGTDAPVANGGTATKGGSGVSKASGSSAGSAPSVGSSSGNTGATQTFVQGRNHPTITGGLQVGGKIDGLTIVRVIHLTATAYGATAQDNYPYGPTDAFGKPLKPGDVAVDPSVISLNTKMYVAGYSTPYLPAGGELAVARDTGGAIKGARIDMYINSTNESLINSFGIQPVTAYILG